MKKQYRHSQVLGIGPDATLEEIAAYKNKKRRIIRKKTGHGFAVVFHNLFLAVLAVFWLIPIVWLVLSSLSTETGLTKYRYFPDSYTFQHYIDALTNSNSVIAFPNWFFNTLFVAVFTCLISTLFVLQVSFALSRMRFKGRKVLMNVSMILGLFPGFLSMIAVYFILKSVDFGTQTILGMDADRFRGLVNLILVYSSSSGLGYLIAKGFFDTIPKDIDEAAKIDGASEAQIFFRITIPLSKPIIVYTIITSFLGPWVDFVYAKVILPTGNVNNYTVAIGLYNMLQKTLLSNYYTEFCAGAVMVSIPLAVLFMCIQKYYVEGITGGSVKG
jgi:arabinogalactan oligomer / maltooligosaccharide transport system permease protein